MVILLAGDDEDLLFVLSYALRRRGYETAAVPVAEVAMESPRGSVRPDLVIVDDADRSRRAPAPPSGARSGGDPPVPCVLLTARIGAPAVGVSLGWAAVVPKPFLVADLVGAIQALGVCGGGQALDGAEQPGQPDIR